MTEIYLRKLLDMEIYFDHAAAARIFPCAIAAYAEACRESFANAEAIHAMAYQVRTRIQNEQKAIAKALLSGEKNIEVIPVHSGSDGFRLFFHAFSQGAVVTSRAEHPALLANFKRSGGALRFVPLNSDGSISLDAFDSLLDHTVKLVAIGHIQSETGRIQPVEQLFELVRKKAPNALVFCDEVQAAGKIPIAEGSDLFLFSGHKIGAPTGGAMILRTRRARETFSGKFSEFRHIEYLSGRVEAPLVAGLSAAIQMRSKKLTTALTTVSELSSFLRTHLNNKKLPNGNLLTMTVPAEVASPYILHFSLPGYQSAVIVRMLSARGIHVSSGSACQAETDTHSTVLTAMGWKKEAAFSAIRLSLDIENTWEECNHFLQVFEEVLQEY